MGEDVAGEEGIIEAKRVLMRSIEKRYFSVILEIILH